MHDYIEERIFQSAAYIIENGATVRDTARVFKISKSTVHKDVSERLLLLNPGMAAQVRRVLDVNKAERHIRGGEATRKKYADIKIRSAHLGEAISGRTSDDRNCLSKT